MDKANMMQISYDTQADVLYISIGTPRPAISSEIGNDVLLRTDLQTGEVVGLTVMNLSARKTLDDLPLEISLHPLK